MLAEYFALPKTKHTLTEYFALLAASDRRWEFWDGELICVTGASATHALIASNVFEALAAKLKGQGCRVFGNEVAIKTPSLPPFRLPDLSVVRGKPTYEKVDRFRALVNPIVLIEVLAPGLERLDWEPKRRAYQALSSVREYLLIAQVVPHITRLARTGKQWQRFDCGGSDAVMEVSSLECELPLSEVYRGVEFN